jgi:hypothetical protein
MIRDVHPGFWIQIFFYTGSRILGVKNALDPGSATEAERFSSCIRRLPALQIMGHFHLLVYGSLSETLLKT